MNERSNNVDRHGYRPNVCIVIHNDARQVFWARRVGGLGHWQFPQGGIAPGESPTQALYRELREETGLAEDAVRIRARTSGWLRYRLPKHLRRDAATRFVGQKQKWFLLQLVAGEDAFRFDLDAKPEFDAWRWVSYWYPVTKIVAFKRDVCRRALRELAPAARACQAASPPPQQAADAADSNASRG